jgi:nucleoside-diphosphate-sugar epimerase
MKILILGGSGHVSGAVARAALTKGHEVWAVTRGQRPLPDGAKPLLADRHNHAAMEKAIAGQDTLWDLAVDCICFDVPDIRQDMELLRRCAKQLVFVSSDFVYDPARRQFPQPEESDFWETVVDYGRKKRRCEEELINGDTGDMAWTIVRPCHIYGPTSELGCLPLHGRDPKLIQKLRDGKPLELVGGGHFLQQPVRVNDLAETILSVADNRNAFGRIFNVAGPDIIESRKYYEMIADVLGVELTVKEIPVSAYLSEHPEKAPFMCHRIYDLCAAKAAGLSLPSTPIEEGLRLHVEGLLADRSRNHEP